MKHWSTAIFAAALLLGGGTVSAQDLVDCKMLNENANSIAFFSANTNSGNGNGAEQAVLYINGATDCSVERDADDHGDYETDGNAHIPFNQGAAQVASDPGNSPN